MKDTARQLKDLLDHLARIPIDSLVELMELEAATEQALVLLRSKSARVLTALHPSYAGALAASYECAAAGVADTGRLLRQAQAAASSVGASTSIDPVVLVRQRIEAQAAADAFHEMFHDVAGELPPSGGGAT